MWKLKRTEIDYFFTITVDKSENTSSVIFYLTKGITKLSQWELSSKVSGNKNFKKKQCLCLL